MTTREERGGEAAAGPAGSPARDRLLAAAVEHVAATGVNNLSLRQLAAAIGTSHRMLVYHFTSKRGLLVEVVRAVERQQRDALAELRRDLDAGACTYAAVGVDADVGSAADGTAVELGLRFWRRLTDPVLGPQERLFFEIYGHALQGDPVCAPFLDEVVSAWLDTITVLMRRLGVGEAAAPAQARVALAVTRGLLLDLLTTGDREGVDAAMAAFMATYAGPRG
ncbi:MAG: TetR/AcrR family transcriptional regulator [Actinopolymorphaceae bacterium]